MHITQFTTKNNIYKMLCIRGTSFSKRFSKVGFQHLNQNEINIPKVIMDFEHVQIQQFSLKVSIVGNFGPFGNL